MDNEKLDALVAMSYVIKDDDRPAEFTLVRTPFSDSYSTTSLSEHLNDFYMAQSAQLQAEVYLQRQKQQATKAKLKAEKTKVAELSTKVQVLEAQVAGNIKSHEALQAIKSQHWDELVSLKTQHKVCIEHLKLDLD